MYILYSLLVVLALLLASPWWLIRMARAGKYRAGLRERLGFVPPRLRASNQEICIWIHAVSVGEVLAVAALIGALREKFPQVRIVISTTTATGQRLARARFGEENVFYLPLDLAFAIRPFLRALKPQLVVLAETEFWPNFLRLAKAGGAKIAVVNARISDRSFPGYRRWHNLLRPVLANVDCFLAQSSQDSERLLAIGAPAERVHVSGNLKFDVSEPQAAPIVEQLRRAIPEEAQVIVCGSTVELEEFALWGAFQIVLKDFPNAVMVLAPRHPERFDAVAALASSFGVGLPEHVRKISGMPQMSFWRRSALPANLELRGGVLLLDSIGELAAIYSLATVAFVGGSLVPHGGHNILEPAHFGKPILVGPHNENFRDIIRIFTAASALRVVQGFRQNEDKGNLAKTLLELLKNPNEREALGQRAADVMRAHTGATERSVQALAALLASGPISAPQRTAEEPVAK